MGEARVGTEDVEAVDELTEGASIREGTLAVLIFLQINWNGGVRFKNCERTHYRKKKMEYETKIAKRNEE